MLLPGSRSSRTHALVFCGYAALTAAWFWTLLPVIATAYPNDAGDPALNAWILAWNSRVLPFSSAWWNAPSFFPLHDVAAFTELLVGVNLFASPVLWATDNPVLAYNVAFLLSFPLAAFGAYLLAWELTGNRGAAVIAGVAFGFAPYRMAHLPQLQVLSSYGMAFSLFALHRYLRLRQARWLVLFSAAWLLQSLSNGYYLLYFTVFVAGWAAWFVARPGEWRTLLAIGAAWLPAALCVVPALLKYRSVQNAFGMTRNFGEIVFYSADLTAFLTATPLLVVWGWLQHFAHAEGELFPGITVVLVIALGIAASVRGQIARGRMSRLRLVLAACAVGSVLVAASFLVFGAWKLRIGSLTLVSVARFHKPATWVFVFGAAFLATGPRFADAFRRRSPLAFYTIAAVVVALTCLGPEARAFGVPILYKAPYALLMELPGFTGLRVPTRFWMLAVLSLSAAVALAFSRIAPRRPRHATMAAAMVALAIAAEGWPHRVPVAAAPSLPSCASDAAARPVAYLQLPIGDLYRDIAALHRGLSRHLPVINGYSGYLPPHYQALASGLAEFDRALLDDLGALGPIEVGVLSNEDPEGKTATFVSGYPGARELSGCGETLRMFQLPATHRAAAPAGDHPPGSPLRIASLASTSIYGPTTLPRATDGDIRSRWEVPQIRDEVLSVDLGQPHRMGELTMALGRFSADFPKALRIEYSEDGTAWTVARDGPTYREAFRAAVADPIRVPLRFPLGGVTARYLRLTQHGRDRLFNWSIAELVIASPSS